MAGSVSASGAETVKVSLAACLPGEALRVLEPLGNEALPLVERLADALGDHFGAFRIDAHGGLAGGFVHRRMRRRDDGRPAGHRLDDRDAEAFEQRWIDERARAAIERRELGVGDEAEAADRRARE